MLHNLINCLALCRWLRIQNKYLSKDSLCKPVVQQLQAGIIKGLLKGAPEATPPVFFSLVRSEPSGPGHGLCLCQDSRLIPLCRHFLWSLIAPLTSGLLKRAAANFIWACET